jgi:hypothetical protein
MSPAEYDKTCPMCAAQGEAVRATTAQPEVVLVDLRCTKCAHTWRVTLNRRTGG